MSLDVAPELLDQAEHGEVGQAAFVATVRRSLPYAYALIERVSTEALAGTAPFAGDPATRAEFTSRRAQILNQSPQLRDC